jgi:hypothetical protein
MEFMQRSKLKKKQLYNKGMEIKVDNFSCRVADFESSTRMMGTAFWKAHEILLAMKNRNIMPNLFTPELDVLYVRVGFGKQVLKLNFHIRFLEVHIILNQS